MTKKSKFNLFFLNKYHGFLTKIGLRNEYERIKAMYQPHYIGWQRTRFAINRISRIAKSRNIPAVFLIWSIDNETPLKDVHRVVRNFAYDSGFFVIDLAEDVSWPKENFSVSKTDGHPNAKAHKIAAEAIYKSIRRQKFVPEL